MKARNLQGRMANLKFVGVKAEDVLAFVEARWPKDSDLAPSVLWAEHPAEGTTPPHVHMVLRWPSVVRWDCLATWLHQRDGHEYAAPAQSWRRSCRYLRHLDNPEKVAIPPEAFHSWNVDEDEIAQLMGASKLPILESLVLAQGIPLNRRFEFLVVERGHQPSEVSAALRCMMDLERWEDTRTARAIRNADTALPARGEAVPGDSPFFDVEPPEVVLQDDVCGMEEWPNE